MLGSISSTEKYLINLQDGVEGNSMLDAYIKIFDPTGYSCAWRESPNMIPGVKQREENDKVIKGMRSHYAWHCDSLPSEPFSYPCHSDCYFTTPDEGYDLCPIGA
jgi:hypothetical protein